MKPLHAKIARVLERVRERSASTRAAYLADIDAMDAAADSDRGAIGCSNMAHVAAAAGQDQDALLGQGQEHAPSLTLPSSPPIMICYRHINLLRATPPSSVLVLEKSAQPRKSPAVFLPCAMASPKGVRHGIIPAEPRYYRYGDRRGAIA